MSERTYVFGLLLRLTTTAAGGRSTPLRGGLGDDARLSYRPNWGLPGMTPPEQSGAPVLGFDRELIEPGDAARVVIIPLFASMVPEWGHVEVGDILPMYEGTRVCGHGRVLWRRTTALPLPQSDEDRFCRWLTEGSESNEPDG